MNYVSNDALGIAGQENQYELVLPKERPVHE